MKRAQHWAVGALAVPLVITNVSPLFIPSSGSQTLTLAGGLPPTKSTQIALASKASRAAQAISKQTHPGLATTLEVDRVNTGRSE
jgi:hypothetical protein